MIDLFVTPANAGVQRTFTDTRIRGYDATYIYLTSRFSLCAAYQLTNPRRYNINRFLINYMRP